MAGTGKVRVVTDSGCDLRPAVCEELGIEVVPLTIRFGSEELVDRKDLTTEQFWAKVKASPTLPETAAPAPGAFEAVFRQAADDGCEGVVVVTLSSKMSATGQSAQLAADAVADVIQVKVVDSLNASLGEGLTVWAAAKLAAAGKGFVDVAGAAEELVHRTVLLASLDTLENLRKGGRIGGAQAMLGGLLSIKPMITVVGTGAKAGEVDELGKQRTRSKAVAALIEKAKSLGEVESLGVMHAQAPDLEEFLDKISAIHPRDRILVSDVGAVIGTHVGPACIGVVAHRAAP